MTDIQTKLMELLVEIGDICRRENIRFFLAESTALGAFKNGGFLKGDVDATIAMTADNAQKFMRAVKKEKRADRVLDSMVSNRRYPDFTLRYDNKNTLRLKLPMEKITEAPHIGVQIRILQPKSMGRLVRYSKTFWKLSNRPARAIAKGWQKNALIAGRVFRAVGGTLLSGLLFTFWAAKAKKLSKKLVVDGACYAVPKTMLEGKATLSFEGVEFPVFCDMPAYLESLYGENYMLDSSRAVKGDASLLLSTRVSAEDYLKRMQATMDVKAMEETKRTCDDLQSKVGAYNKHINGYYAIVDRTEKRFRLYQQYMPMKQQLLDLEKAEDYQELNRLLEDYRSALYACYKKKLGLCFDKDIFELTMRLLSRESGNGEYVKKLRAMVPAAHWEPMTITDYKGDPIA